MIKANIHYAKTHLSKLIEQAEAGEEVVIARSGKPAVRLTPIVEPRKAPGRPKLFGAMRGQIVFAPDYETADAEIAEMFEESINRPVDAPLTLDDET